MPIEVKNKRVYKGRGEYIGRPSSLGNPFRLISDGGRYTRDQSIAEYRKWLAYKMSDKKSSVAIEIKRLSTVYAKTGRLVLVCWCAPLACHGDVVKEMIEMIVNKR